MTFLAFIVAILILVSLHELGHYLVARWCGVKVTRFSVGFGTPFFKKKRGDTEWCLAPIPLGGYVKMVDTREGPVADADLPYAFDRQHPAKRIAIVIAGPLTNLLLAVLLYGLSFSFGVTELKPWVGTVEPHSLAERAGFQAGDKITAVNGEPVADWAEAQTKLMLALDGGQVKVAVQNAQNQSSERVIQAANEADAVKAAAQGRGIGLLPFRLTLQLGQVVPDSPAAKAGLQVQDTLLAVDGQALTSWPQWVGIVQDSPGKNLRVQYSRNGQAQETWLRPDSQEVNGMLVGKVGLAPQPDAAWQQAVRHQYRPDVPTAFGMAAERTWSYSVLTLKFFGKMLIGQASLQHISGPLTIADVAGKSAAMGLQSYIEFLALVSVSLGVLNLLPIPVLDGGHLLYYALEWIRGKPLSERLQAAGVRFGLMAMLLLMFVALFNDVSRLFG